MHKNVLLMGKSGDSKLANNYTMSDQLRDLKAQYKNPSSKVIILVLTSDLDGYLLDKVLQIRIFVDQEQN